MSKEWAPQISRTGVRLQAGIPRSPGGYEMFRSRGLILRGVVIATYVVDDPDHPSTDIAAQDKTPEPVAVYCDVLCYSDQPGNRWFFFRGCPVSQDHSGLHDGRAWKPKAATQTLSGNPLSIENGTTDPADTDGDHVLVGFMDDSMNQPVILRAMPHPSRDPGNLEKSKGHRLQLKLADGNPDFWKHRGTFYGVDDNGDFIVDTTYANDGSLDANGHEPAQPTDGKGAQRFRLPVDAEDFTVEFLDSSEVVKASLKVNKDRMEVRFDGETLLVNGQDGAAALKLGDGSAHAALWEDLKAFLSAFLTQKYNLHKHPTAFGPSGPPDLQGTAPADTDGRADRVTIPAN